MAKFKVGDIVRIVRPNPKVKRNDYKNAIRKITKIDFDGWYELENTSPWRWQEGELELYEQPTVATKLKLDSGGVTITADACTIQSQLYKYATVTQLEKKEGNKMIESINLIDLYVNKKEAKIREEAGKQIAKIRKESEIVKKVNEIMETAEKQLNELYLSQLSEEDLEKVKNGETIDYDKYQFVREGKIELCYDNCEINELFVNDEIEEIKDNLKKQIKEIEDLEKLVKAHVGIAKTKEEVEEILERYGIIDKKTGKLVIE